MVVQKANWKADQRVVKKGDQRVVWKALTMAGLTAY